LFDPGALISAKLTLVRLRKFTHQLLIALVDLYVALAEFCLNTSRDIGIVPWAVTVCRASRRGQNYQCCGQQHDAFHKESFAKGWKERHVQSRAARPRLGRTGFRFPAVNSRARPAVPGRAAQWPAGPSAWAGACHR